MESLEQKTINELALENHEELETVGRTNSKHFRKEGLKLMTIGISIIFVGILVFYVSITFHISSNTIVNLAILFFVGISVFVGISNLIKGIKNLVLPVPIAPSSFEKLLDNYYSTFFSEVSRCLDKSPGKSLSWMIAYVCLLKKERDKIGNYNEFVKSRKEIALQVANEIQVLRHISEIQWIGKEFNLISNSNGIQTYNVKFIFKMFTGARFDNFTHVGNMEILEYLQICTFNNRLYIYDATWQGKPKLL